MAWNTYADQHHLHVHTQEGVTAVTLHQCSAGCERNAVGVSALHTCTIFARFQHLSQECHRWRGTPAL
jgi:hypothetical protein